MVNTFILDELLCSTDTFNCTNDIPTCIPTSWVCDGHIECIDGSDENIEMCGGYSYVLLFSRSCTINVLSFKQHGNVRRTNSPVKLVLHVAFRKQENAINCMIVLIKVMRLENSVVSVLIIQLHVV